jgi:hypothetical protein
VLYVLYLPPLCTGITTTKSRLLQAGTKPRLRLRPVFGEWKFMIATLTFPFGRGSVTVQQTRATTKAHHLRLRGTMIASLAWM